MRRSEDVPVILEKAGMGITSHHRQPEHRFLLARRQNTIKEDFSRSIGRRGEEGSSIRERPRGLSVLVDDQWELKKKQRTSISCKLQWIR